MPSTFSDLKIELMATGENNTTWGAITNLNLEALEQAVAETSTVTFASANQTLTLTDSNAPQAARALRLRCAGTTGGTQRDLIVPTFQKLYIVRNDCADNINVKTAAGTGVVVAPSSSRMLYVDGVNVVDSLDGFNISAQTVGTLPVNRGGTGATDAVASRTNLGATAVGSAVFTAADAAAARAAIGAGTGSGSVTSVGGTGTVNGITLTGTVTASGNLTLGGALSGVDLATQTVGTLAVARGGTGATDMATARTNLGATAVGSAVFTAADAAAARAAIGAGTVTSVGGAGSVNGITLTGTVTSSGNLTLGGTLSGVSLTTQVTGTLPVANGGTGAVTFTANRLLRGNGTSAVSAGSIADFGSGEAVRIDTSGNVGVGTTSPSVRFEVVGPALTPATQNTYAMWVASSGGANGDLAFGSNGSNAYIQSFGGKPLRLNSIGNQVAVGSNAPTEALTVTGNIRATGNVISDSDERLKENVETITKALDKVRHMRGVTYTLKGTGETGTGVIAQEMLTVMPEVVNTNGEHMAVAYGNLVGVLIEAIKELSAEVAELRGRSG